MTASEYIILAGQVKSYQDWYESFLKERYLIFITFAKYISKTSARATASFYSYIVLILNTERLFFTPTAAENRPDYNAGGFSLSGQQHRTPVKTPPWNPPVAQPLRLAANKPGALAVTKGQLRQFPFSLNHLLFYDKVTNCGGEVTF